MTDVIISLDISSRREVDHLLGEIGDAVSFYKVGAVPFLCHGIKIIEDLKSAGKQVFLDLKFFDIPNTVRESVKRACDMGVDMMTVHLFGGMNMLQQAIEGRESVNGKARIVGVTVLTSLASSDFNFGVLKDARREDLVSGLTERAFRAGLDGVVCSGDDVPGIRSRYSDRLVTVCPGIRLNDAGDDQKSVVTPYRAAQSGADYIVVGRPVYGSPDPLSALEEIQKGVADGKARMD